MKAMKKPKAKNPSASTLGRLWRDGGRAAPRLHYVAETMKAMKSMNPQRQAASVKSLLRPKSMVRRWYPRRQAEGGIGEGGIGENLKALLKKASAKAKGTVALSLGRPKFASAPWHHGKWHHGTALKRFTGFT